MKDLSELIGQSVVVQLEPTCKISGTVREVTSTYIELSVQGNNTEIVFLSSIQTIIIFGK